MACEKCWRDACMRAMGDMSKTKTEHYMDLLEERRDNPCTENEQVYGREDHEDGGDE